MIDPTLRDPPPFDDDERWAAVAIIWLCLTALAIPFVLLLFLAVYAL